MKKNVGILAFQGGVIEHRKKLEMLDVEVTDVRYPEDIENIDAIILPGGESTCIKLLLNEFKLLEPLAAKISKGLPVWGTCAGAILLALNVDGQKNDSPLALLDISIERNGYGSQLDSFCYKIHVPSISEKELELIFVRAPKIKAIGAVTSLVTINNDSEIVAVQKNHMMATTFHPELSNSNEFHRYFLEKFVHKL